VVYHLARLNNKFKQSELQNTVYKNILDIRNPHKDESRLSPTTGLDGSDHAMCTCQKDVCRKAVIAVNTCI